jgi:hypothetical protein
VGDDGAQFLPASSSKMRPAGARSPVQTLCASIPLGCAADPGTLGGSELWPTHANRLHRPIEKGALAQAGVAIVGLVRTATASVVESAHPGECSPVPDFQDSSQDPLGFVAGLDAVEIQHCGATRRCA